MSEKNETKKQGGGSRFLDVILSLALLAAVAYGGYYIISSGKSIDQTTNYVSDTEETTEPPTENKIIFENKEYDNSQVYNGSLILVNAQAECQADEEDIVSLYQVMLEHDTHSFGVRDGDVKVSQENAENLIAMFDAFYNETYDNSIVVQSGYRSYERQKELYDADLSATGLDYSELVAVPGHSEHQTGWCVDLTLIDQDYDGTGIYSWIDEHCFEFGMILRYAEDKSDITEITSEPWHYRYVGKPHAYYITKNNLCLEEYIDLLYKYPYDGEHLEITDTDGKIYEIFYYPADSSNSSTLVPVPSGLEYTISGNNIDGFIITVDTGETEEVSDEEEISDEEETSGEEEISEAEE